MLAMSFRISGLLALLIATTSVVHANPYENPAKVPKDTDYSKTISSRLSSVRVMNEPGLEMARIGVKVDIATERYSIVSRVKEFSGTPALVRRAGKPSGWGSYRAVLKDAKTDKAFAFDSIGTGKEYRKLVDAISFRFPMPASDFIFELQAENPVSGKMEQVLRETVSLASLETVATPAVEVFELNKPTAANALRVNFYADGYLANRKSEFLENAKKAAKALLDNKVPGVEAMHFFAVFSPSAEKLGNPKNLGFPIPEKNTFLGLYYPYWSDFGRWYHVVYPTREEKFRRALASAPYDYPIALIDESSYWGIGNFRAFTAVPSRSSSFTYLLLHEIGHFFGLNEEYEGGGRTELEFAPGIQEPWSQNITFLREAPLVKWQSFVTAQTRIPTPMTDWKKTPAVYGAYKGGYADSEPHNHSHKPGLNCVMDRYENFCDICRKGINDVVEYDRGH